MNSSWYVYLLRCADDTFYCGITTDMAHRLRQHNGEISGGAKYTHTRQPVELMDCAPCLDRIDAMFWERKIKSLPRAKKLSALLKLKDDFDARKAAREAGEDEPQQVKIRVKPPKKRRKKRKSVS